MFIDQQWKNNNTSSSQYNHPKNMGYVITIILAFLIGISAVFGFLIYQNKKASIVQPYTPNLAASTPTKPGLPGDLPDINDQNDINNQNIDDIKIEEISFGHFYEKDDYDFISKLDTYELPLNIKTEVSNYYDIARKLEIDNEVDNLNNYGFTVINTNNIKEADNFFDAYRFLLSKEIPVVLTNDFAIYYYQNKLKEVYKDIEKNVFFESLWNINKKMYDTSLLRYRSRLSKIGMANDPILEAQRLETAFFAVTLNLLSPTDNQINAQVNFVDEAKFTKQDSENYIYNLPSFLVEDVEKEVRLIRDASSLEKSPVFLYDNNYTKYIVPQEYKKNAKLNNFYLATKWLNSTFPLHYLSDDCNNCLLDRDDWEINMITSNYIAMDLDSDQELKNDWAVIYKIMGFFKGLRQDLTYLYVVDAAKGLFGDEYSLEDVFAKNNPQRKDNFDSLRDKLLSYKFYKAKGGIVRTEENKNQIGLKVLQENYWPNEYVYEKLVGNNLRADDLIDATSCQDRDKNVYRCKCDSRDIVNLIDNEERLYYPPYTGYETAIHELRNEISRFDEFEWNNNIFWFTLDELHYLFYDYNDPQPVYKANALWQKKRNYNTITGAWVDIHLPRDEFGVYQGEEGINSLVSGMDCSPYSYYIETDTELIRELIAKNDMLIEMISLLGIGDKTNLPISELDEMGSVFEGILGIQEKQLSNKEIDYDDCRFIKDFISREQVVNNVKKEVKISDNILNQKLSGVKFLLLIYEFDGKKVLSVGPIYNQTDLNR